MKGARRWRRCVREALAAAGRSSGQGAPERAGGRPSERLRVPQPVIKRRIASGRGAMEQPNATGDGDAALSPVFWVMVVFTGIATGLFGDLLMWVLFGVQHLAFNYHSGDLQTAVERASDARRVLSLLIAGAFGAGAWYLLRRYMSGERTEIDDAIWNGDGTLGVRRSLISSLISEVVIGMGASLGREAAPKLMGGVSGSVLADWARLSPAQRRLLVACGGGAGLAAVYNVPLGGALFTAEILCGSLTLPTILPAVACSWIATVTAWLYLPDRATYLDIPAFHVTASLVVWSLAVGPLVGLLSSGYVRLIGWVSHQRARDGRILVALPGAFLVLGLIGLKYPELFGNGKDMAHSALLGEGGLMLFGALFVLKPLVTALCIGGGGSGGLFTPTLSTGAVFGAFLGGAWSLAWPGSPIGAFAMVGGAAMIGASMQAPLTALVVVLELTHSGFGIVVPMMAAVVTATAVTRHFDGYSIYSARLRATPPAPSAPPAGG
jgi:chloride channel protein, CIC family